MEQRETALEGCLELICKNHYDSRGYLVETFRQSWFKNAQVQFIQDNQSLSTYGTIRGLHFQRGEHAQAKLVRVISGKILDVAVDLWKGSSTYGKHIAIELSAEKNNQLWIPKGFAHGFSVLSETAIVCYKCDAYYNKESESGIHPLDNTLGIDWQIPKAKQLISEKDLALPLFIGEVK